MELASLVKISGFTFVRHGEKYDYPYLESISSLLPVVDELVVNVGIGDDSTLAAIQDLASTQPKIRIVESEWDPELRSGGQILAQQTDLALAECTGDWCVYLQADEVLPDGAAAAIRKRCIQVHDDPEINGLLFDYVHFYGAYDRVGTGRRWYRREIRAVRNIPGIHSWKDAQGFRFNGQKITVAPVDVSVFHYGWVRTADRMRDKKQDFEHWWSADKDEPVILDANWDFDPGIRVQRFAGRHPSVMAGRINAFPAGHPGQTSTMKWLLNHPLEAISAVIEAATGVRLGEYRNYRIKRMSR